MPLITLEGGKLTKEQKNELIEKITQISSEITHIPSEFFSLVLKNYPMKILG
ncbi:MAG: tautomerase family protein [Eubacteriaceae bacterium]|jgi:4-oxalocrotonate tautomerase